MPPLVRFARRFVAGEKAEDALARVYELNKKGVAGIVAYAGEHYKKERQVEDAAVEYVRLIKLVKESGAACAISLRPTQLGLDINKDYCQNKVRLILEEASKRQIFVWIDAEGSQYTQQAVDLYGTLKKLYPNVGLTLQAGLKRSEDDLAGLLTQGALVRLEEGTGRHWELVGDKVAVTENYSKLMRMLFEKCAFFQVATHNPVLLREAKELQLHYRKNMEFSFLMGVSDAAALAHEGFRASEYVPYGKEWLSYYGRRVSEKPSNLLLGLKDFFIRP